MGLLSLTSLLRPSDNVSSSSSSSREIHSSSSSDFILGAVTASLIWGGVALIVTSNRLITRYRPQQQSQSSDYNKKNEETTSRQKRNITTPPTNNLSNGNQTKNDDNNKNNTTNYNYDDDDDDNDLKLLAAEMPQFIKQMSQSSSSSRAGRLFTRKYLQKLANNMSDRIIGEKRMHWPWDRDRSRNSIDDILRTRRSRRSLSESDCDLQKKEAEFLEQQQQPTTEDSRLSPKLPSPPPSPPRRQSATSISSSSDTFNNNTTTTTPTPSSCSSSRRKSGICIGSIFGLDIGGTLAKIVYLNIQPTADYDPEDITSEMRQRRDRLNVYKPSLYARAKSHSVYLSTSMGGGGGVQWPDSPTLQKKSSLFPNHSNLYANTDPNSTNRRYNQHSNNHHLRHNNKNHPPLQFHHHHTNHNNTTTPLNGMKASLSMVDFSKCTDHVEALDSFYEFARHFESDAPDAGGSSSSVHKDKELSFYSRALGGEFHFIHFESGGMIGVMELIKSSNLHVNIVKMGATGGGAFKYAEDMKRILGIEMTKEDEMDSLVAGMQFVLSDVVGECYTFKPNDDVNDNDNNNNKCNHGMSQDMNWSRKIRRDHVLSQSMYPYLLVIIGTGVSILRVDGPRQHERVSGSTIGGGTYWGLCRLLTDVETFEDVMNLSARGDPTKVDMMVGDIYGNDSNALEKLGLPPQVVASSFGKLVAKSDPASGLKQEDLARALLVMITNNIGQVAFLNAQMHNTSRIFFVGTFLRHNDVSQRRLAYAINYWSRGEKEALFLEHEGYFGALGAFLLSQGL